MRQNTIRLAAFSLSLLTACVPYYVEPPRSYEPAPSVVVEVPVLPPRVILSDRPYYSHRGYVYYWDTDRGFWLYSRSRRGPWHQLPRSHYPREFQYRGRWYGDRGGDDDRGRERDRDDDRGRGRGR